MLENYVAQDDSTETHKERKVTDEALKPSKHSSFSYYPQIERSQISKCLSATEKMNKFQCDHTRRRRRVRENQKIGGVREKGTLERKKWLQGLQEREPVN